jgi:hypothetical protein
MGRIIAVAFLLCLGLCHVIGPASAQTQDVAPAARLLDAMMKSNRNLNSIQSDFIADYATRLVQPLRDFDGLIEGLENPGDGICNLLCRNGVVPRFWLQPQPTAVDIVRYVFSSTCFGVLPQHREQALAQLDTALGRLKEAGAYTALLRQVGEGPKADRHYIRAEFGDLLRTADENFTTAARFKNIFGLWQASRAEPLLWSRTRAGPPELPPKQVAAQKACETSFVERARTSPW